MSEHRIKNFEELARTDDRKKILEIIEAGLDAIDTVAVIKKSISLNGNILKIKDKEIDLERFERIKMIGFGKVVCPAAKTIKDIIGDRIVSGAIINLHEINCGPNFKSLIGSHPRPSIENFKSSEEIVKLSSDINDKDLVLVIVSGGGSALLCWPEDECTQGQKLYDEFLKYGGTIMELNRIRKHTSGVKGGGLAKMFYPATVVGLIFCDVPGDYFNEVASGPTYKDETTVEDAQKVLDKYKMNGFNLTETPKDDKYFEKVINIPMVSNSQATQAMADKAAEMGLKTKVASLEIYETAERALELLSGDAPENGLSLGGGEIRMEITISGGTGGRNQYLAMNALKNMRAGEVFASVASDGLDNGDAAGAIVDSSTIEEISKLGLDLNDYIQRYDSYSLFQKTNDLIFTGQTMANVSDLMIFAKFNN